MSATVPGCGHACHMMEINFIEASPQIHLHFLTGEDEHKALGFGRVELCCHGCGESLLVLYDDSGKKGHLKLKRDFRKKHEHCPNHGAGYAGYCPNYRSSFQVADLRAKLTSVRGIGLRRMRP